MVVWQGGGWRGSERGFLETNWIVIIGLWE